MEYRTNIDQHGRILIPAQIRKELGCKSGDIFVIRVIEGEIRMLRLEEIVKKAQSLLAGKTEGKLSMVEEFLKMRQEERQQEVKGENERS